MIRAQRFEKIMALVEERGVVSVTDLTESLGVSVSTVRRDLEQLDALGRLRKTYGGAVKAEKASMADIPLSIRQQIMRAEKERIAQTALKQIKPGAAIYLNPGTTAMCLASRLNTLKDVTVVTSDLDIATEIAKNRDNRLIISGGELKADSMTLTGLFAEEALEQMNVDIAFLSADSMDLEKGFLDYTADEAPLKRLMLKNSKKAYMMLDHAKFENQGFVRICHFTQIDGLITDDGLPEHLRQALEERGVPVLMN